MSSITQQLLEATDIIASREAKQVSFDQTILCTVVQPTIENEEDMCYVGNGTIKFKAKNATGNKLSKNTSVYVTVPSGDYSNEKIIIATYKEEEADDYKQTYADITQDFIQAKEYSLSDFLPNNLVMLLANYDTSTDIRSCNYNFANDKIYFGHYNRVIMKAKFAMDVPELIAGEYIVRASFLDNSGEELWFGEISSKEILGNPYTINSSFEQEALFTTGVIVEGEEGQETKQLNFDLVNKIQIKFYTPKADAFIDKDGENISWSVQLEEFKLLLGYHKANFIVNHGNIENGLVKIVLVDNTGKEILDTKDILTPYHNTTYKYDRYFGINYVNNSKIEVLNPLNSDISWRRYNPSLEDVWSEKLSQTGEANKYFKGTVKTSYNSSQFKAVYKDISSNIIKISKNDKDFETSSEDTLLYDVEDNNYNLTYPIYDQADEVISSGIRPKFTITGFKNSYGDIEKNKVPMTVIWKIPVNATMISKPNDTVFSKDKKREWSDGSNGWYTSSQKIQGTEDFWNKVFILEIGLKNSFSDGATNNTIICQIIRDDDPKTTYQAKIVLHPARVGTTGEDFGLIITPDRSCLTNNYWSVSTEGVYAKVQQIIFEDPSVINNKNITVGTVLQEYNTDTHKTIVIAKRDNVLFTAGNELPNRRAGIANKNNGWLGAAQISEGSLLTTLKFKFNAFNQIQHNFFQKRAALFKNGEAREYNTLITKVDIPNNVIYLALNETYYSTGYSDYLKNYYHPDINWQSKIKINNIEYEGSVEVENYNAFLTKKYEQGGEKDGRMILTASLKQISTGSDLTDDYDEQYWYDNLKMEFIEGSFGNMKNSNPYAMTIKKIGAKGISKHSNTVKDGQNISDIMAEAYGDIIQSGSIQGNSYYVEKPSMETTVQLPSSLTETTKAARSYMIRIFEYLTSSYFCVVKATFKLRNGRVLTAYQSIPRNFTNDYKVSFEGPGRIVYDSFGKLKTNTTGIPYKATNGEKDVFPCVGVWYPGANGDWKNQANNNNPINNFNWEKENTNPPSVRRTKKDNGFIYNLVPSSTYPRSKVQVASLVFYKETYNYNGKTYYSQYNSSGVLLNPQDALGSLPSTYWNYIYPLVIIQDTYFNDTIDAWDGSITQNDEVGMVLATSFAAGKKDSTTNEFTGIIMGDTSGVGNGLFGFHQGVNTFGFTEKGSCWIGKNENGSKYIEIDTNGVFKIDLNTFDLTAKKVIVNTDLNNKYLKIDSSVPEFEMGTKDDNGNIISKISLDNNGVDIKAKSFHINVPSGSDTKLLINSSATGTENIININSGIFSVTANGYLTSTSCKIGDDNSYLKFNTNGLDIKAKTFYVNTGNFYLNSASEDVVLDINDKFSVYSNGSLYIGDFTKANSNCLYYDNGELVIDGNIYSKNGTIGGWYITQQGIQRDNLCLNITDTTGSTERPEIILGPKDNSDTLRARAGHIDFYYEKDQSGRLGQSTRNWITIEKAKDKTQAYFWVQGNIMADNQIYCLGINNLFTGLGTSVEANYLNVNGGAILNLTGVSIYLKGTVYNKAGAEIHSSDKNKKNSIQELTDNFSLMFDNLNPVMFKYNNGSSGRYHSGFIAQEVKQAMDIAKIDSTEFAGLVIENVNTEQEEWGLRYAEFVALNTSEIQKLKARVNELENRLK